jgi:hypothetical protein
LHQISGPKSHRYFKHDFGAEFLSFRKPFAQSSFDVAKAASKALAGEGRPPTSFAQNKESKIVHPVIELPWSCRGQSGAVP